MAMKRKTDGNDITVATIPATAGPASKPMREEVCLNATALPLEAISVSSASNAFEEVSQTAIPVPPKISSKKKGR